MKNTPASTPPPTLLDPATGLPASCPPRAPPLPPIPAPAAAATSDPIRTPLRYLDRRSRSAAGGGAAAPPRNVGEGLLKAGEGVAGGLFRGLAGVISKPIEGAQRGGVLGFATGVAQGAVGLVVKPVVGVADGITSASEGIRNTSASASSQGIFAQRQVRPFAPVARHCHAPPQTQCTRRLAGCSGCLA